MSKFLESAAARETSSVIMDAIWHLSGHDDERAEGIWMAPSEAEALAIWECATNNGRVAASETCWGAAGSQWAVQMGIQRSDDALVVGRQYDVSALRLLGWTEGDGTGAEGYCLGDYFDAYGHYLGPDAHGIEPRVEIE